VARADLRAAPAEEVALFWMTRRFAARETAEDSNRGMDEESAEEGEEETHGALR